LAAICQEPCLAYSKVLLHHYIGGEIDEEGLYIRTEKFYRDVGITPLLGVQVKMPD
jgi:NAD(P)H-nitrite reductase large subunit